MSSITSSEHLEKLIKKTKAFKESCFRQPPTLIGHKTRIAAFFSIYELANLPEWSQFCKEHVSHLVSLMSEHLSLTRDRFAKQGFDSLGTILTMLSDLHDWFQLPLIFTLTIRHILGQLQVLQEERSTMIGIIACLLHPGNPHELRQDGLIMLMTWIREAALKANFAAIPPDLIRIYASMIQLNIDVDIKQPDSQSVRSLEIQLNSSLSFQESGKAIEASPIYVLPLDSPDQINLKPLSLLSDLLHWMTWDTDADKLSVAYTWVLFRHYYLDSGKVPLPEVDNSMSQSNQSKLSAEICLAILVRWIKNWSLHEPSSIETGVPLPTSFYNSTKLEPIGPVKYTIQPSAPSTLTTFLWEELLMRNQPEINLIKTFLQQALKFLAPSAWYQTALKDVFAVIKNWIFIDKDRRPLFMSHALMDEERVTLTLATFNQLMLPGYLTSQASNSGETTPLSTSKLTLATIVKKSPLLDEGDDQVTLAQIRSFLDMLFLVYGHRPGTPDAIECFKEVQDIIRTIAIEQFFTIDIGTWLHLLDLQLILLEKALTIDDQSTLLSQVLAAYITDTLISTWIKSKMDKNRIDWWNRLAKCLSRATNGSWSGVLNEWAKAIERLVHGPLTLVYTSIPHQIKAVSKSGSTSIAWEEFIWTKENALFLTTNMLYVLGDPCEAKDGDTWHTIIKTLVDCQEILLCIYDRLNTAPRSSISPSVGIVERSASITKDELMPPVFSLVLPLLLMSAEFGLEMINQHVTTNFDESEGGGWCLGTCLLIDTLCNTLIRSELAQNYDELTLVRFLSILHCALTPLFKPGSSSHVPSGASISLITTVICSGWRISVLPGARKVLSESLVNSISCLLQHWDEFFGGSIELQAIVLPMFKFAYNMGLLEYPNPLPTSLILQLGKVAKKLPGSHVCIISTLTLAMLDSVDNRLDATIELSNDQGLVFFLQSLTELLLSVASLNNHALQTCLTCLATTPAISRHIAPVVLRTILEEHLFEDHDVPTPVSIDEAFLPQSKSEGASSVSVPASPSTPIPITSSNFLFQLIELTLRYAELPLTECKEIELLIDTLVEGKNRINTANTLSSLQSPTKQPFRTLTSDVCKMALSYILLNKDLGEKFNLHELCPAQDLFSDQFDQDEWDERTLFLGIDHTTLITIQSAPSSEIGRDINSFSHHISDAKWAVKLVFRNALGRFAWTVLHDFGDSDEGSFIQNPDEVDEDFRMTKTVKHPLKKTLDDLLDEFIGEDEHSHPDIVYQSICTDKIKPSFPPYPYAKVDEERFKPFPFTPARILLYALGFHNVALYAGGKELILIDKSADLFRALKSFDEMPNKPVYEWPIEDRDYAGLLALIGEEIKMEDEGSDEPASFCYIYKDPFVVLQLEEAVKINVQPDLVYKSFGENAKAPLKKNVTPSDPLFQFKQDAFIVTIQAEFEGWSLKVSEHVLTNPNPGLSFLSSLHGIILTNPLTLAHILRYLLIQCRQVFTMTSIDQSTGQTKQQPTSLMNALFQRQSFLSNLVDTYGQLIPTCPDQATNINITGKLLHSMFDPRRKQYGESTM